MWKTDLILITTISAVVLYQQNDYEIVLERVIRNGINKDYLKLYEIGNFKYNRTAKVSNSSVIFARDVKDIQMSIQAYKFASNEYRLFPITHSFNVCDAMRTNRFGLSNLSNCGNFPACNFKKDVLYIVCNWGPDSNAFPPGVPRGNYKLNIKIITDNICISDIEFYGNIVYKRKI